MTRIDHGDDALNTLAGDAPRILLVGGGRLACTLLRSMSGNIRAVLLRDAAAAARFAASAPAVAVYTAFDRIPLSEYDTVWIVTSDASIAGVAAELARQRADWHGVTVLHSSGATSAGALDPLAERGATTCVLHPNGSFTGAAPVPRGIVWGVSEGAGDAACEHAMRLIGHLAPKLVVVRDQYRVLYHAAASVAANYSVTLFAIAAELYRRAGFSGKDAREVVAAFMHASADRAASAEPADVLTGPIARGDADVVRRQYEAVRRHAPEYFAVLEELALATARIAGSEQTEMWRRVVEGENSGVDDR